MVRVNVIARCAAAAALFALAGCSAPSVPAPAETASTAPTVVATTRAPSTSPPPASSSSATSASGHTTSHATTTSAPPPPTTTTAADRLTAARVIDGDTIVTSAGDTIRLAGIDTPERGQCGYSEATANLRRTLAGNTLTLTKAGLSDRDKYGRLIRYVDVGEQDAGMGQIMGGFARARYDSRDGYGRHPRQDDYVAADAATPSICAASTTQGAESTATKTAAAPAASATATREETEPDTETEPPETGKTTPYANCAEVREAGAAPLHRGDPGYSTRLDRDGDGTASAGCVLMCEHGEAARWRGAVMFTADEARRLGTRLMAMADQAEAEES